MGRPGQIPGPAGIPGSAAEIGRIAGTEVFAARTTTD